jgi:hypothetical protein
METIPQFVIAGIPLIVVVFALVEEIKAWGLTGKILRAVALVLGLLLALAYQLAILGVPTAAAGWFNVAAIGLIYGLTASGAYNFLDARFPPKA